MKYIEIPEAKRSNGHIEGAKLKRPCGTCGQSAWVRVPFNIHHRTGHEYYWCEACGTLVFLEHGEDGVPQIKHYAPKAP